MSDRAAAVDDFARRWSAFAATWSRARRRDRAAASGLVDQVLREGLPRPKGDGAKAASPDAEVACAVAVIARSGLFDASGYAEANETAVRRGQDPLAHYCAEGWRELRAPSLAFDLWWYWVEHLDPTRETVDPLLHYLLEGRHTGLEPLPPPAPDRAPARFVTPPRRVCLFAGYDRDGLVDPYVVDYLRELGRFAAVYYLADGVLESTELAKLADVTKGAWSIPHAAYDFGSFSLLARDLVGWDVIDSYDELLLVNDSCFLLRPLDEVFAEMDSRACDWWSLQATSMEHQESYVADDSPIPLGEAKRRFIGPRRWTDVHYLHLSSYFLAFRLPVHREPGFRWRLDTVAGQRDKHLVIHKYEVGLSRHLMDAGYEFDTFIEQLYPFHPLYSRRFFELVDRGFPLVKRNFLAENPKHVVGLEKWADRLRETVPDAPVEHMAANIARVSPADRLAVAYDVAVSRAGLPHPAARPFTPYKLRQRDRETASHGHWWGFPVSASGHRLDPGVRAVFEAVRDDPSIHKVLLTRSRALELPGENVSSLPISSRAGQEALVRCGRVFVDDEPDRVLPAPLLGRHHDFVHVGIGLPLAPLPPGGAESSWSQLRALAVSSHAEALVRAAGNPDLALDHTWVTGLPRHDFLVAPSDDLPDDVRAEEEALRTRLSGRRLLLWWFHAPPSPGLADRHEWLGEWCRRHDVVLGVREPRVDRRGSLSDVLSPLDVVQLSDRVLGTSTGATRLAWAVVTDGAPEAFDALVLGKPVLHVAGADVARTPQEAPAAVWPRDLRPAGISHCAVSELEAGLDGLVAGATTGEPCPGVLLDGHNAWRVAHRARRLAVEGRG